MMRWQRGDLGSGTVVYIDKDGKQYERPPRPLRLVTTQTSRFGIENFDFSKYNTTRYAGLENTQPNTFLNPLLQLLYFIPSVHYALKGHFSGADSCLSDELGFLFHMLDQAQNIPKKSKCVEPLNFLRYFSSVPEAAALGLLEPSKLGLRVLVPALAFYLSTSIKSSRLQQQRSPRQAAAAPWQWAPGSRPKQRQKGTKHSTASSTITGSGAFSQDFVTPSPLGGNVIEDWFGCTFVM